MSKHAQDEMKQMLKQWRPPDAPADAGSSLAQAPGLALEDALRDRDAYFNEAARVKGTLSEIIPALERASGLKADDFRHLRGIELTGDEIAALWLARAILEAPNAEIRGGSEPSSASNG